jgi:nucleoside-diphosphate-sugar epimerase
LGGTRFIGRAAVEEMVAAGDDVLVVHRGVLEPDDMPAVEHLHCAREELAAHRDEIASFGPEAAVDFRALTRSDAELALAAFPGVRRWVVISSVDVYRAFGALNDDRETDPVPLDEESPLRANRYPYRGQMPGMDDYDKLDVEETYLPRGAAVLRLPMVFGERDYQRREEFVLRRVRAGRERMPFGAGQWLACRVYVRDAGRAVRLALTNDVAGEVMNVCDDRTYSMAMWTRMILDAAGSNMELVRVPDSALPDDLKFTGTMSQHIVTSARKARALLGWTASDPVKNLAATVRWHLDHPPADASDDFGDDDRALTKR